MKLTSFLQLNKVRLGVMISCSLFVLPLAAHASFAPVSLAGLASVYFRYLAGLLFVILLFLVTRMILQHNNPAKKIRRTGIVIIIIVSLGVLLSIAASLWLHILDREFLKSYEERLPQYQEVTIADLVNTPQAFVERTSWVRVRGVIEKRTPDRCTKLQGATPKEKLEMMYQRYPSEWVVTDGTNEVGIKFKKRYGISQSVLDESIPQGKPVTIQGSAGYRVVTVNCISDVFYPALIIQMDVEDFTNPLKRPDVF